ncbi:MAG: hypothetical protein ACTHJN_12380 [Ginsengibacter sp.]|jgi:hypothetical protein
MKRKKPAKPIKTETSTAPEDLSYKWFTEEQMLELFGATKPILREWRRLGLRSSNPTARHFFNETDVQEFLLWYRNREDNAA